MSIQDLKGRRENVVPSETKSRQQSPRAYFCSIVRQAAKRCLAISTPVRDPKFPSISESMQSLAPDIEKRYAIIRLDKYYSKNKFQQTVNVL